MGSTQSPFSAITAAYEALELITKVSDVTATGVKALTVNFNQAVTAEQQATATVTVKKGTVTTNLDKKAFSTDGTSVVLTTSAKLTKGTYTVTAVVNGVTSTDSVDVVDEKVSSIALTSDKAVQDAATKSQAKVYYEVKNQYGEVMTGQGITWSISTGVAPISDNNKGELVIGNAGSPAAEFIPGSIVYITGVHATSGTVMNASVTIGLPAKADTVDFLGVYNTATKKVEALPAGFAAGKYVLLYEAFDQYGHKLVPSAGQIVYTVDNPLFINSTLSAATPVLLGGVTYQSLALVPGTNPDIGGTANINAISTVTGTNSSYAITADSLSLVKTFTMSAPADLVVAGEKSEIPFDKRCL